MIYEEIEKLDKIISKRLGKKANILWQKAKNDLFAINVIRKHIIKVTKVETEPKGNYNNYTMYVDYIAKKINEEDIAFLTNWLKENVDKESLRKWLDDDLDSKQLELKAYKRAYEWKCNGVEGTYEELLDKAKKTIIADEKLVKGVNVE